MPTDIIQPVINSERFHHNNHSKLGTILVHVPQCLLVGLECYPRDGVGARSSAASRRGLADKRIPQASESSLLALVPSTSARLSCESCLMASMRTVSSSVLSITFSRVSTILSLLLSWTPRRSLS